MSKYYKLTDNESVAVSLTDDEHFASYSRDDADDLHLHHHQQYQHHRDVDGDTDDAENVDYQVEDLIQYNDTAVINKRNANMNNNNNVGNTNYSRISNGKKTRTGGDVSSMNGGTNNGHNKASAGTRHTTTTGFHGGDGVGDSSNSSTNLLISTLDFDDSTMEIPLLQHGDNKNNKHTHSGSYNLNNNKASIINSINSLQY